MQPNSPSARPPEMPQDESMAPQRRRVLGGMAAGGLAYVMGGDLFAAADDPSKKINQSASEHARPTSHPAESLKIPRWKPGQSRRFDLAKPLDNHYAFAKTQANLIGTYSWLCEYGWVLFCPPGKPPFPILGRVFLARIFVTAPSKDMVPDADEHAYVMWGTMSKVHVDPRTFEPVSKVLNPYTGRMMEAPVMHYADRLVYRPGKVIVVPGVDPAFYNQPWDRDGGYNQHHVNAGSETSFTVLGASQQPGPHQPRVDSAYWTVRTNELLDPARRTIDTRRAYSAVMKATEYAWYGVEKGDAAQLMVNSTGIKTEDPARLPSLVRRLVLERFPQRFG